MFAPWEKSYDQLRQRIKNQRHYFANKGSFSQSYGFSSSHVWMWEFYYKESWVPKNWFFWTVELEKTLESPLDCKEIQPVHPKGDQSWIFIGRTDAEAETPILWPPDGKNWPIGKDPDAGKDWGQEEKGMTEVEMVGWHQWLNGHEFELVPAAGDGQGGLACSSAWGHKELDTTERLNWTEPPSTVASFLYFFPSSPLFFQDQWIAVSPHSSGNSFITKPSSLANKSFVAIICSYFSSWLYITRFLAIATVRE